MTALLMNLSAMQIPSNSLLHHPEDLPLPTWANVAATGLWETAKQRDEQKKPYIMLLFTSHWPEYGHMATPSYKRGWKMYSSFWITYTHLNSLVLWKERKAIQKYLSLHQLLSCLSSNSIFNNSLRQGFR